MHNRIDNLASALKASREKREAYEASPNRCLTCNNPILLKPGEPLTWAVKKRFCTRSCAAKHNNAQFPKRRKPCGPLHGECKKCESPIVFLPRPGGGYNRRQLCDTCLFVSKSRGVPASERTKGELFANRKNWQSARSSIRQHASVAFAASGRPLSCEVCGYDRYAEIAHKRSVSDFPAEATLAEINTPENLVALCPNHHWEFDHGILNL